MKRTGIVIGWVLAATTATSVGAQEMTIEDYAPRSTLRVPAHPTARARFPFVDVHAHHPRVLSPAGVDSLVRQMDSLNMAVAVNLSGGTGERLRAIIASLRGRHRDRFAVFANLDFDGIGEPGWTDRAVTRLVEDVRSGAQGLKIFKSLGLRVRDTRGVRVPVNDARLDPIWAQAGELGIPVLIHTGDPAPFWEPHDRFNERWLELKERPERKRGPDDPLPWEDLMAEQWDVFRRHPGTTFLNAHLGWLGNDLARLGRLMDEFPNMHAELGAVLAEVGRQPRTARGFFIRYQDRLLMGKDSWAPDEYRVYFRTLETADEYFDYYRPRHAHWKLYGLDLPDEVLRKVYYANALRLIPGLNPSAFDRAARGAVPGGGAP